MLVECFIHKKQLFLSKKTTFYLWITTTLGYFGGYSDKLAHIQVVINCQYYVAQMCTREDTLSHYLGAPSIDDVMRHNTLITVVFTKVVCMQVE